MPKLKQSRLLTLTALLLVGLAAFLFWHYQSKPQTESLWQAKTVKPFKQWFQINWQNQAVGWASVELIRDPKQVSIIEEDFIEGWVQGQRLKFRFKRQLNFSNQAPYNLLSGRIDSIEPQLTVEKVFENKKQLSVKLKRNQKLMERDFKAVKYSLKDYLAVRRFIEQQPKLNDLLIVKELNSDDFGLHYSRYQVQQVKAESTTDNKVDNNRKKSAYFQLIHQLQNSNKRQDTYQSEADFQYFTADGMMVKRQRANGINLVASQGKVSLNPDMQRDLYLSSGLKINRPLGNPRQIQTLELSLHGVDISRLKGHPALTIKNNRLLTQAGYDYYAPPTSAQSNRHQKIASIAQSKVATLATEAEKVRALLSFVHSYLTYQVLPASFNLDDILINRIGDCTEHALLLTEMLNSVGVPAREVSGLIYLGDEKQRFGGHVWVEAYFDGKWHGIDPTWNLFELTATHIPLAIGADKSPKILSQASKASFQLETIQLKQQ